MHTILKTDRQVFEESVKVVQQGDEEITDESFGGNPQVTFLGAGNFRPDTSSTQFDTLDGREVFVTGGPPVLRAVFNLPSGARLISAKLYAFDEDVDDGIFAIYREEWPSTWENLCEANTSGTPGYVTVNCNIDHIIANADNFYHVGVALNATAQDKLRLFGVRLFWRREIGPAGPQRFSDVPPSHNFFREINNLAFSGITTGFGDGTYRPSQNVTRGQMAAFLARALGLYWPYEEGF